MAIPFLMVLEFEIMAKFRWNSGEMSYIVGDSGEMSGEIPVKLWKSVPNNRKPTNKHNSASPHEEGSFCCPAALELRICNWPYACQPCYHRTLVKTTKCKSRRSTTKLIISSFRSPNRNNMWSHWHMLSHVYQCYCYTCEQVAHVWYTQFGL